MYGVSLRVGFIVRRESSCLSYLGLKLRSLQAPFLLDEGSIAGRILHVCFADCVIIYAWIIGGNDPSKFVDFAVGEEGRNADS